jgi:hypothetical protein
MINLAPGPIVCAALAGLAFINVAKFLEIVMRSQHRVGINTHEQPVIWVLRRFVDHCCYFESFVSFGHWSELHEKDSPCRDECGGVEPVGYGECGRFTDKGLSHGSRRGAASNL